MPLKFLRVFFRWQPGLRAECCSLCSLSMFICHIKKNCASSYPKHFFADLLKIIISRLFKEIENFFKDSRAKSCIKSKANGVPSIADVVLFGSVFSNIEYFDVTIRIQDDFKLEQIYLYCLRY